VYTITHTLYIPVCTGISHQQHAFPRDLPFPGTCPGRLTGRLNTRLRTFSGTLPGSQGLSRGLCHTRIYWYILNAGIYWYVLILASHVTVHSVTSQYLELHSMEGPIQPYPALSRLICTHTMLWYEAVWGWIRPESRYIPTCHNQHRNAWNNINKQHNENKLTNPWNSFWSARQSCRGASAASTAFSVYNSLNIQNWYILLGSKQDIVLVYTLSPNKSQLYE